MGGSGVELHQLRCFAAVAEAGTVTAAAGQLFMTQSALSRVIARLEQELGKPLFTRAGRRLELNSDGELFYECVAPALRQIDFGVTALQQLREAQRTIRIHSELLPGMLDRAFFQCEVYFPTEQFEIVRWPEQTQTGGALPDMVLTAHTPQPGVRAERFWEPWCFLLDRSDKSADAPEFEQIIRREIVLYGPEEDARFVRAFLRSCGVNPQLIHTLDHTQSSRLMQAGLAIGCAPLRFFLNNWEHAPAQAPFTPVLARRERFGRPVYLCCSGAFSASDRGEEIFSYLRGRLAEVFAASEAYQSGN